MGRAYTISSNATTAASATLPMMTLISTAAIRPRVYEVAIGSDADAANAAKWALQRCTTAGTAGSALTPAAIDSGDPAAVAISGLAVFSVGPTLTANAFPWQRGINQRQSYNWQAVPGREIVLPATAANGIALMTLVIVAGFNAVMAISFDE